MNAPHNAMILAAGRGTRMRPLSDHTPKPLIEIAGHSMLDRMLDRFATMETVVVNAWHLADQISEAVAKRSVPSIRLSREAELLDTGGGVVHALPLLGNEAFFVANGDVLLTEPGRTAVESLVQSWDDTRMDALLLLVPGERAGGFRGAGDFSMDEEQHLTRRGSAATAPWVYASIQIVHPRLLDDAPAGPFSFNLLWDRALSSGRLFGVVHDGGWFTVDTPGNITTAEAWLAETP